jgi:phosphatidyl-myo-inositol alpha-mannosyltransferase
MKVVIVCPYAWDRFGGVQSHVASLAPALVRRGYDVRVMAPVARADSHPDDIVVVGRAVPIPANGSTAPLAFGPVAAADVKRELELLAPDVVHVHEPLIPSLSLLALRGSNLPAVGTFHAAAESSFGYRASRPALIRAGRRLTVKTAVSEAARSLIARYLPGDYLLTPNGIDVARFASARPLELSSKKKKVLFFGRIEPRKGLDVLIEAMTWLRDLDVQLVVAGSGPDERSARSRARRLGIDARFLGAVDEKDKPRIFKSADVYCAPGLGGESFGIVIVEAMAAGAPVVCSALPAFKAVVGDAAEVAAPDDPGALGGALRCLLTDPEEADRRRRLGELLAASFDWSRQVLAVEKAYGRALERGGPARARPGR